MTLPRTLIVLDEAFVEVHGRLYCPYSWWRFARAFSAHTQSTTLFIPVKQADHPGDAHPVDFGPMQFVPRPYYVRIHEFYAGLPFWWRSFRHLCREQIARHDLVICRMPGPACRWTAAAAAKAGVPIALFVAGDVVAGSGFEEGGPLIKRMLSGVMGRLVRGQENWVARRSCFVGVWDTQMRPRFEALCPNVADCQSPNLTESMLTPRDDTCTTTPVRLLRVARLSPVKNVELLLDAMALLVRDGRDLSLEIAGGSDIPDYEAQLRRRVADLELEARVTFSGSLEFGPPLFDAYRRADIHVISSRWEGLPRCLAEGRAFGLPTVATHVGGIPAVVRDGEDGLLVPPDDPAPMARAIARLIDDPALRRSIIAHGFSRARESTAEYHAARIARLIGDALPPRRA